MCKNKAEIPAAYLDTVTDVLTEVCVYERKAVRHKNKSVRDPLRNAVIAQTAAHVKPAHLDLNRNA